MAASKKRPRADLLKHLLEFLQQHVSPGQRLLLGLSGGLDSCVLLDLLIQARRHFDFHLSAIHVNHRISPNADAWAKFCDELCAGYDIPCQIAAVNVSPDTGWGLEAAARNARYGVMLERPESLVMLAHHQDDQAETVLLQLSRGAGVDGLSAMSALTMRGSKRILRPLLGASRAELHAYANAHQLKWIEDESNRDVAYDRNFIRHEILPSLETRFPAASRSLARSASHLAEVSGLLDEYASEDAVEAVNQGKLNLGCLRKLTHARAKNLLRWWIRGQIDTIPSTAKLDDILRQLLSARQDAQLLCNLGSKSIRRFRDQAYIVPDRDASPFVCEWNGETLLKVGAGLLQFRQVTGQGLALRHIETGGLTICSRRGGERFKPNANRPTLSLRNLFQEAGVPAWLRNNIPLIYSNGQLVAVPYLGIAYDYRAMDSEPGLQLEWHEDCFVIASGNVLK